MLADFLRHTNRSEGLEHTEPIFNGSTLEKWNFEGLTVDITEDDKGLPQLKHPITERSYYLVKHRLFYYLLPEDTTFTLMWGKSPLVIVEIDGVHRVFRPEGGIMSYDPSIGVYVQEAATEEGEPLTLLFKQTESGTWHPRKVKVSNSDKLIEVRIANGGRPYQVKPWAKYNYFYEVGNTRYMLYYSNGNWLVSKQEGYSLVSREGGES